MDFLTNLYSNDNFGIILFITISILVLAFLVVLFFGKKDQKERKLAETKSLEVNNTLAQNAFGDDQPTVQLNIDPEIFDRVSKEDTEPKEEPSVAVQNITPDHTLMEDHSYELPTDFMEEEVSSPEPIKEENVVMPPKMDFDFDALADSISKELENISQTEKMELSKEPIEYPEVHEPEIKPVIEEPKFELPPKNEEIKPVIIEEPESTFPNVSAEKPKMPSPTQFSSVFVSKKKENKPIENYEPKQTIVEDTKEPVIPEVTPAKPNMELPKTIDLPKLNNNANQTNKVNTNIVFSSLEDDVSTYSKDFENRM